MEIADIGVKAPKTADQPNGQKILLIEGTHAVALAAQLCRVQVIAAYPISPSTSIAEKLSDMVAEGKLKAKYIRVESEHSSMSSLVGAAQAGARTFSATASQGLAYMHEVLHWAAGSRLPIVLCNANRALGSPWNLGTDQTDSIAQRDTGWLQFYCETNQDILDTVIQAYRIAEQLYLPVMVNLDAFYATHTMEKISVPSQEMVDRFLPKLNAPFRINFEKPSALGGIAQGDTYYKFKYRAQQDMERAFDLIEQVGAEYEKLTGRRYGITKEWFLNDAETLIITSGTCTGTARMVVKKLREKGEKAGLLRLRVFRPFPKKVLYEKVKRAKKIIVIDRNIGLGVGGVFAQEIRAALYNYGECKPVFGFIDGIGGKDITPEDIEKAYTFASSFERPARDTYWIGVDL